MKTLVSSLGLTMSVVVGAPAMASSARADVDVPPHLRLTLASEEAPPSRITLLPGEVEVAPASMSQAMLGEIGSELETNLDSFETSLGDAGSAPALEGGGDGGGALLVVLAAILGFVPGFGLGHLVAGHIGGFILFLCVDLILSGVFFVVFPLWGFSLWYVPSALVVFFERIVEAVLAGEAATAPGWVDLTPSPPSERMAAVRPALPILTF